MFVVLQFRTTCEDNVCGMTLTRVHHNYSSGVCVCVCMSAELWVNKCVSITGSAPERYAIWKISLINWIKGEKPFPVLCTSVRTGQSWKVCCLDKSAWFSVLLYLNNNEVMQLKICKYRMEHEKPARRLIEQCGRRSRTLYRKLNKCKCKVLTG